MGAEPVTSTQPDLAPSLAASRSSVHAHLVQLDSAWENPAANYEQASRLIQHCAPAPGDLVILPEMFDTGFSFNIERTVDSAERTLSFLKGIATRFRVVVQAGRTVAARVPGSAINVASVLAPAENDASSTQVVAEYAKIHLFQREAERFIPGREVVVFDLPRPIGDVEHKSLLTTRTLRVCPAICYDIRFPELFRVGLAKGAEVFAIGACWPKVRQHHWRSLLVARAIENQAIVLGCNRTGVEPSLQYGGGSIAVGPKGEILGELGEEPGVLTIAVDPNVVRSWRSEFRAWRDQQIPVGFPGDSRSPLASPSTDPPA